MFICINKFPYSYTIRNQATKFKFDSICTISELYGVEPPPYLDPKVIKIFEYLIGDDELDRFNGYRQNYMQSEYVIRFVDQSPCIHDVPYTKTSISNSLNGLNKNRPFYEDCKYRRNGINYSYADINRGYINRYQDWVYGKLDKAIDITNWLNKIQLTFQELIAAALHPKRMLQWVDE